MTNYRIAVIPGDGIGPEVMNATIYVLNRLEENLHELSFQFNELKAGDDCKEELGIALPVETIEGITNSDACLFAAVGESARDVIIPLRQRLELFANIRPLKVYPNVPNVKGDLDLIIVRENSEGLYKGNQDGGDDWGIALRIITRKASFRIARYAFNFAIENNRKKVTCVHKANVLTTTCGLFLQVCREVAQDYPDIEYKEELVDACAMKIILQPRLFDVILTTNLFGDILSDLAAGVVGGLGLAPSGNIGEKLAIFEPVHGTAPDIAGKGLANPIATILSAKMMLNWLGEKRAAESIEDAILEVLREGSIATPDLGGNAGTVDIAKAIADKLSNTG